MNCLQPRSEQWTYKFRSLVASLRCLFMHGVFTLMICNGYAAVNIIAVVDYANIVVVVVVVVVAVIVSIITFVATASVIIFK